MGEQVRGPPRKKRNFNEWFNYFSFTDGWGVARDAHTYFFALWYFQFSAMYKVSEIFDVRFLKLLALLKWRKTFKNQGKMKTHRSPLSTFFNIFIFEIDHIFINYS